MSDRSVGPSTETDGFPSFRGALSSHGIPCLRRGRNAKAAALQEPAGGGQHVAGGSSSLRSRRTLLKGAGVAAFGSVGSVARAPAVRHRPAQAGPARRAWPRTCPPVEKKLIVSNWPAYIDAGEKKTDRRSRTSRQQTGIKVDYTDDVNDNAEFFAKVRNQLGACEPIGRDMMVLTDWMAARMIGLGWIQPLDAREGAQRPQEPDQAALQGRQWDKDRTYSRPGRAA